MRTTDFSATRRRFLRQLTVASALFAVPGLLAEELVRTPRQTEGPFYPDGLPLDTDNDLILVNDSLTPAVGEITHLSGRLLDSKGQPIRNALVEIWQVDVNGDGAPVLFEQGDIGFQIQRLAPWIPQENIRWSYAWIKGAAGPASRQQVKKFTDAVVQDDAALRRGRPDAGRGLHRHQHAAGLPGRQDQVGRRHDADDGGPGHQERRRAGVPAHRGGDRGCRPLGDHALSQAEVSPRIR